MEQCYAVLKTEDTDGIYLFAREEDAQAFYAECDERTTIFTSEPIAS